MSILRWKYLPWISPVLLIWLRCEAIYHASYFEDALPTSLIELVLQCLLTVLLVLSLPPLILFLAWKPQRKNAALALAVFLIVWFLPAIFSGTRPTVLGMRIGVARHGEEAYSQLAAELRSLQITADFFVPMGPRSWWVETPAIHEIAARVRPILQKHAVSAYHPSTCMVSLSKERLELSWGGGRAGTMGVRYFEQPQADTRMPNDMESYRISDRLWVFTSR